MLRGVELPAMLEVRRVIFFLARCLYNCFLFGRETFFQMEEQRKTMVPNRHRNKCQLWRVVLQKKKATNAVSTTSQ